MTRRRRWLTGVAAISSAVVLFVPSLAVAAGSGTISFSVGSTPQANTPFSITVSGTTSVEGTLRVKLESDGRVCPSPSELPELGDDYDFVQDVPAGAFSRQIAQSLGAGSYMLCGYLSEGSADTAYATGTGSLQVAVESPSASEGPSAAVGVLLVKVRTSAGTAKVAEVTVSGEGHGKLFVHLVSGSSACPSGQQAEGKSGWEASVKGGFTKSKQFDELAYRSYRACAYLTPSEDELSEEGEEGVAIKRGEATFTLTAPTPAHLERLRIVAHAYGGSGVHPTFDHPGYTELQILTGGEPIGMTYNGVLRDGHTPRTVRGAVSGSAPKVEWSCAHPAQTYRYEITVTDAYGKHLTRRGKFRTASTADCHTLQKAEARERREREAKQRKERRSEHEKEARQRSEGDRTDQEDKQVEEAQRNACTHDLHGRVERVDTGEMIPPIPSEIETECAARGHNYTLRGDPPIVVSED